MIHVPSAMSGVMAAVGVATKLSMAFGVPVLFPARVTAAKLSGEPRDMAPVLTRLFTPLFTFLLVVFLATMAWTGSPSK